MLKRSFDQLSCAQAPESCSKHTTRVSEKNTNQLIRNVHRSIKVIQWREWHWHTIEDFGQLLLLLLMIVLKIFWFDGTGSLQIGIFLPQIITKK